MGDRVVAVHALVEVPNPDVTGRGGQHVLNAVEQRALPQRPAIHVEHLRLIHPSDDGTPARNDCAGSFGIVWIATSRGAGPVYSTHVSQSRGEVMVLKSVSHELEVGFHLALSIRNGEARKCTSP